MTTPNLSLPELVANQSQPHISLNAALRMLDAIVQASIISQTATPPGSPAAGDRYLVGAGATGAWAGKDDQIAVYIGPAWSFFAPQEGWLLYLRSDSQWYVYGQNSPQMWEVLSFGPIATDPIFDAKGDLPVGTGANAAQRLAVGTNGQVLSADSTTATGLKWAAAGGNVAADAIFDAKGDLAVGTGANTAAKLAVGTNGQVLSADSTTATGLKWAAGGGGGGDVATDAIWTADGQIAVSTGAGAAAALNGPSSGTAVLGADQYGNVYWQQMSYPIDIFIKGKPGAGETVGFIIAAGMTWNVTDFSSYSAIAATTYGKQIKIYRNGTLVGELNYDDAGFMEFADDVGGAQPYSGGNIKLVAPATQDATMADIGIRFWGTLP